MAAPTRRGPALSGRSPASTPQSAALGTERTPPRHATVRGSHLRLTGDAEMMAADLIERVGPVAAAAVAAEVVALVGGAR